jgi:hypothetical protein
LTTFVNTPSSGCVLALFHHVSVTLELDPLLVLLVLLAPLLQAASTRLVAAAATMAATARLFFIECSSPRGVTA